MRKHPRLVALASCVALTATLTSPSAVAAPPREGLIYSVANGGRLATISNVSAVNAEVNLLAAGQHTDHDKTVNWAFEYDRQDKTYSIYLPDENLCWHRDQLPNRTRVKLAVCSESDAARWVLEPVTNDDQEADSKASTVVVIRPVQHRNQAVTVGASQVTWWLIDVVTTSRPQRIQHWKVPFDLPSQP